MGRPTSLVSCTSRDEAMAAARWYAARYGWRLDRDDVEGGGRDA